MPTNTQRLEIRRKRMAESLPVLRGGFRPFFLGAATWAILSLAGWLGFLFGQVLPGFWSDPVAWHRHEMLFSFVDAAIAGFALTAVPNWTGRLPIAGWPLAALFALWVVGRLLPFVMPDTNLFLILVDGGFYVVLAALLGREILQSRNRNTPVVLVIAPFGIADLIDRLDMAGIVEVGAFGWRSCLALVLFLVAVIGGRIRPSFTRNCLAARDANGPLPTQPGRFDKLVLAATALGLLAWLGLPPINRFRNCTLGCCARTFRSSGALAWLALRIECNVGGAACRLSMGADRLSHACPRAIHARRRDGRDTCPVDRCDGDDDYCGDEPGQPRAYGPIS